MQWLEHVLLFPVQEAVAFKRKENRRYARFY